MAASSGAPGSGPGRRQLEAARPERPTEPQARSQLGGQAQCTLQTKGKDSSPEVEPESHSYTTPKRWAWLHSLDK